MKLSKLKTIKNIETVFMPEKDYDIVTAYTSDLLSDVMGNADENSIFITIQAHTNSVAVAQLVGIKAILICNNRTIPKEMIATAKSENIAILRTTDNQFISSYKIGCALKVSN